jgi:SAM-dependent methyltransferase
VSSSHGHAHPFNAGKSILKDLFRGGYFVCKPRVALIAVFLLQSFFLQDAVVAQDAASAASEQRKTSEPYTGDLSIFDSPGREDRLQINRVMDILGIAPGKAVADIGAGSGWFTVRAARRVGGSGTVYGVDINAEAIRYIGERAQKEQLKNVKTILSKADDPMLPDNSVDAVLLLKTYHEVAQPVTLMRNLHGALRPGAKVGIIDRNGNGEDHGVGRDIVLREAKEAGYKLLEQYDFVKGDKMDYFLVFTRAQ